MALPPCRRCGKTDSQRMIGLMTRWFGTYVDLEPANAYFHLCPGCYEEFVEPHLQEVLGAGYGVGEDEEEDGVGEPEGGSGG